VKARHSRLFIPAILSASIIACSGGGGQLAGIGGSGYISTGTVTGFGSVFVNGVKFEVDNETTFEVEDQASSQSDLRIGMVVQVKGSINPDGVSGNATQIRYGDQLEGPVVGTVASGVIDTNPDGTQKSFRVLGTNVIVDSVDTVFDGTSFDFGSITLDNTVEISGYFDENQTLRATFIRLISVNFDPTENVEIEGVISNLLGSTFNIDNVNVNATSATAVPDGGLQTDLYVEVKGTYDIASNTITAVSVEQEDIELNNDGSEVSVEGYITRFVDITDFDVNGVKVDASAATFLPASLQSELALGKKIEVEGAISNQVLIASSVEVRGGDAEIFATVSNVLTANADGTGTLTISPYTGAPAITITATTATNFEDSLLGLEPFNLQNISAGDFVEIIGFEDGIDSITATKLKRREVSTESQIQGIATSATGNAASGSITILGVTYSFNSSTSFDSLMDISLSIAEIDALISTINTTDTLIKIVDVGADGNAEQIDVEN